MTKHKQHVLLSWSSGKDSAWALHVLRQRADLEVVGLLTTFNEAFDRVAMHGVRRAGRGAGGCDGVAVDPGDASQRLLKRGLRESDAYGARRGSAIARDPLGLR